ncbi:hypothetical protein AQ610_12540 [Burkholderia humptydooensis]|nr:hypothetical protein AQ610_12540 [Burkholderia humptydooensis]
MRRFGLYYGIAFAGYGFGAVVGPLVAGSFLDLYRDYALPLQIAPIVLVIASVLLISLGISYVVVESAGGQVRECGQLNARSDSGK